MKVIICDDHDLVRKTVGAVLTAEGYVVEGVRSADELLLAASAGRPDVVIMDLRLGGESGVDAIAELRDNPGLADVPVLLLSGEPLGDEPGVTERTRADAFLQKPFDIEEFVACIERLARGDGRP